MNIIGVGTSELLLVLVIMMVVAGPKRMIIWANLLGQYWVKLRRIWSEMVKEIQKELDDAGVDVKLPKTPPTRTQMDKWAQAAMKSVSEPLQEDGNILRRELDYIEEQTKLPALEEEAQPETPEDDEKAGVADNGNDYGTWNKKNGDIEL